MPVYSGKVWLVVPGKAYLVSPYERYEELDTIRAAQPFTVSLLSCVIAEDLDDFFRGKNDILILTRSSLGNRPKVERVHFYEKEIPAGEPILNLFAENVFITDDYPGDEKLWLEIDVLEVDTDDGQRRAALRALQSLALTAGAAFPAIAPFAFPFNAVTEAIEKIISLLEKDKSVIRVPFALYPGEPRRGRAPLQAGTYVVFAQDRYGQGFKLDPQGILLDKDNRRANLSYVTFDIVPQRRVAPAFVQSQKLATLLTQLRSGNGNTARTTLDFLTETLTDYSYFQKLERYRQLAYKPQRTPEEEALMQEIEGMTDLRPYLPQSQFSP